MKTNNEKWVGKSKTSSNSGTGRDGKPFEKRDVKSILKGNRGGSKYNEKESFSARPERSREDEKRPAFGEKRSFVSREARFGDTERKSFQSREGSRTFNSSNSTPRKPWENRDNTQGRRDGMPNRRVNTPNRWESNPNRWEERYESDGEKSYGRSFSRPSNGYDEDKPRKLTLRKPGERSEGGENNFENRHSGVKFRPRTSTRSDINPNAKYSQKKQLQFRKDNVDLSKPVRLNKYLANAGICSRREADEYIQAGVITVNGEIVSQMGVKILPTDKVMFHNQPVRSERKVYLLLNKPKDCVTTSEDTHARLTVLDIVKNACSERIYPVGRLDRNTTGVLLLTNDGDLASKLTHPKYEKKKIYHATLDKPLQEEDYNTILKGVTLDDENIAADALEYVKPEDQKQIGIEIHSGQNRVVRRIFEKLGYKVIRLDRVCFAGLTKKNLARGKYRFLTEREVNILKMGAHE